jgi:MFS transporter, PPP family, 3-phenylpropionic acid transporter
VSAAYPYWRLSSFYFFYFALLGAWLPFWPLYLRELGYGAAAIGLLAGALQATKIISPHLWGWLADRTGARLRIIRFGAFAAALIFSGIFIRHDFAWLLLIVVGYSFFWNAVHAQFEVITVAHLRERAQRYSLIRVWGSIGFIAIVTGLGFLFDHIALSALPFILLGLLLSIWGSTLAVSEPYADSAAVVATRESLWVILRRPMVLAFLFANFLLQLSHGPYYTFFSVYLEQNHYSKAQTGVLWSLGVVAEVLMFLLMHRLLAAISVRAIMLISFALTALRWVLIALFVDLLPVLIVAQCLHAASFATLHASAIEIVRRVFVGGHEGQGMALYSGLCFGAGATAGAIASGLLWNAGDVFSSGLSAAANTFLLAALIAMLAFAVVAIWLRLPGKMVHE